MFLTVIFLLVFLFLSYYRPYFSNIFLQVQSSGLWPWPAEFLWSEVRAVACSAHHEPQGCTISAPRGGATGSDTKVDAHQVFCLCVEFSVFLCSSANEFQFLIFKNSFSFLFWRILAFSEAPITAVHVSVDGEPLGKGHSAGGPLYVLLWDPSLYLTGLHTIRVKVEVGATFIYLPLYCVLRLLNISWVFY